MLDEATLVDVRRENLRALADELGGVSRLAEKLGTSQGYISHLIGKNPTKPITDKAARRIEEQLGKEHGWLDRTHGAINEALLSLVMEELDSLPRTSKLTAEERRRLAALFYVLVAEHGVERKRLREIMGLVR